VLTHTGKPAAVSAATQLVAGLSRAGITSLLPADDLTELRSALAGHHVGRLGPAIEHSDCELVIVLGGDGTILRGAEWALAADIPLLGVNLGHIGFLAEAESTELDQIVPHVVQRTYPVEQRSTIVMEVCDADGTVLWDSFAVNEVSIEKDARERMLEVLVEVDGRPLSRWGCDGVLVSTPTGSTAYAFSAGGPVIWPDVDALLLVPLSAHALFARPLVLGPRSTVRVELLQSYTEGKGVVWCDGRRSVPVKPGQRVSIRKGPHRLLLARLSQAPFTDRLVGRFGLRVEGWRGANASQDTALEDSGADES